MKFSNLFSSSSGNCMLVEEESTKIIIDAGCTGSAIEAELIKTGVSGKELDGILVTHEHTDHIKGVGVLSRRYNLPVFASKGTWTQMQGKIGNIAECDIRIIEEGKEFNIKDLEIHSFEIPHDAAEPVGYIIDNGKEKIASATDMGMIFEDVVEKLGECKFVFLESNHDAEMLRNGNYPQFLKRRIFSPLGHLSNEDAGKIISKIVNMKTEKIRLGHLSKDNNLTSIALETVKNITSLENIKEGIDYELTVANREGFNGVVTI